MAYYRRIVHFDYTPLDNSFSVICLWTISVLSIHFLSEDGTHRNHQLATILSTLLPPEEDFISATVLGTSCLCGYLHLNHFLTTSCFLSIPNVGRTLATCCLYTKKKLTPNPASTLLTGGFPRSTGCSSVLKIASPTGLSASAISLTHFSSEGRPPTSNNSPNTTELERASYFTFICTDAKTDPLRTPTPNPELNLPQTVQLLPEDTTGSHDGWENLQGIQRAATGG